MADHEYEDNVKASHERAEAGTETKDRGLFDFVGKKEEEKAPVHDQEEVIVAEFNEKVEIKEEHNDDGEKKHSLLEKLRRSDSSSSSSSDEEEIEGEEKMKKKKEKKGKKEKIKEKITGDHHDHEHRKDHSKEHEAETAVPVEKYDEVVKPAEEAEAVQGQEEKKGFLEKIKEKLPGQHKKSSASEEVHVPSHAAEETICIEGEVNNNNNKEKKGIFEKIKEKIPGYHSKDKSHEEDKEKEKKAEAGSH